MYALEFKQEAVRLVESGPTLTAAARSLGVVEQTLSSGIKLHRAGGLNSVSGKNAVTASRMDLADPGSWRSVVNAVGLRTVEPGTVAARRKRRNLPFELIEQRGSFLRKRKPGPVVV